MRFLSTLHRTLSLHFLVMALLPTLVFGVIAITLLHRYLQDDVYERSQILSREIAATTEQFLSDAEYELNLVATTLAAGTIVRPEAVDAYLQTLVQRSERFESVYLLDRRHHVRNLGLAPRSGLNLEDYRALDFSRHAFFEQRAAIDQPIWSDTFISLATGDPSITLAIPVADGVLFGNLSLQSLSRRLGFFTMAAHDSCTVLDHVGTVVAASDPELIRQRVNFSHHRIIDQALHGKSFSILELHGDREVLESVASVPRTGWVAWVGRDLGASLAPVRQIRNVLAGVMVVAMLLAAGLALLDARRLMLPLSALAEKARKIGAGNYEFQFQHSGFTEIDSLAGSLQAMSTAVSDREQSILASETRFRTLVNSIDGIVWEMDIDTCRYLFVSQQVRPMLGYQPEQWLNDPDFLIQRVHAEDKERILVRGRRSLALGDKHDLEYRLITASGRTLWVRDLVTVVWKDDEPQRLLGVIVDVTGRKQAEAELTSYRAHLEELVAQRTRDLERAQSELVQKERLAVLGQLTAMVSHEIRNPLGTVANALFLLRETLDAHSLRQVERPLALAERSIQRCDGIINELLDFTRQRELQREHVQLDPWLAETLDELSLPGDVLLSMQLNSGVTIQADPERLRRALVNVVTNAVQALDEKAAGEKLLEIRTDQLAGRCEIVVRDTGPGIPPQCMARIYEPLFSTKSFGVGLGVPIIRNIMTDHGGGVTYASEVGVGTTVTLWLPLDNSPARTA